MSIDAIAAVTGLTSPAEITVVSPPELAPLDAPSTEGLSFDSLVSGIQALNDKLVASSDAAHAVALGQADNLHQVMMSGAETRLAFDLLLQVRGKILDAYQELLRMQV